MATAEGTSTSEMATPDIRYDLFGTVNHLGNLQSGHYVANVKVDSPDGTSSTWYHCNDQHVSYATSRGGSGEQEVLDAVGAYLLFYIRS